MLTKVVVLEHLGAVLRRHGAVLGRLEAVFGRQRAVLVRLEAVLDRSWGSLGCHVAVLGRSWTVLGWSWGRLEAVLGRSWRHGAVLERLGAGGRTGRRWHRVKEWHVHKMVLFARIWHTQ